MKRSRRRWKKIRRIQQARLRWNKLRSAPCFRFHRAARRLDQRAPRRARGKRAGQPPNRAFRACARFLPSATLSRGNSGLVAARRHRSAGRRAGVECHSRRSTARGPHSLLHCALLSARSRSWDDHNASGWTKTSERRGALRRRARWTGRDRCRDVAGAGTRSANRGCASGLRRRDPPTGDGDGRRSRSRGWSCLRRTEPSSSGR